MSVLMARIKKVWWLNFILDVTTRFGADNGAMMAAGLSFFMVLAFIPILLVGIAALGYYFQIVHSKGDAMATVQHFLMTQVMPGAAGTEVQHLMAKANVGATIKTITDKRGISGVVGVVGLVWSAIQIYISASTAMNAAWETREKRGWVKLHLIALGLLVCTGVFLVLSLTATAVGTALSHRISLPGTAILITIGSEIGAVLLGSIMYTITYKFLPSTEITWKAAICGGVFAAVAWEVAKKGLAVWLTKPNHNLYGNLADLFVFVLWVYYSMMILLYGAEVSAVYSKTFEGHRANALKRRPRSTAALDAGQAGASSPINRPEDKGRTQAGHAKKPGHTPVNH